MVNECRLVVSESLLKNAYWNRNFNITNTETYCLPGKMLGPRLLLLKDTDENVRKCSESSEPPSFSTFTTFARNFQKSNIYCKVNLTQGVI